MPRAIIAAVIALTLLVTAVNAQEGASPYAAWRNGPPSDPDFFPLAVWAQNPDLAEQYKEIGINTYVALWRGPTEEQLAKLEAAGMKAVCHQNDVGLAHIDDPVIIAWMHGDEPDNAQSLGSGQGYGPPVDPAKIIDDYKSLKQRDPSRPVLLNLGQGVAWNDYVGRGVGRNSPGDYAEYIKGSDIVSFDIYPVTSRYPQIKGNLWYVAEGVDRLQRWSGFEKVVWNCIETAHINADVRPTPAQVRAEVWMSLIHGSRGLIYFVHEWKPASNDHAMLDYPDVRGEVGRLNARITSLAPVLNSPTIWYGAEVDTGDLAAPVDIMLKRHDGATYLFAVAMRDRGATASFLVSGLPEQATAEVLDEGRTITVTNGEFQDDFDPYGVHLYRIR